jgi:DNA-binding NarL/FixJ family response regulator
MARPSFAIDLVETGYHLGGSQAEWFERVLAQLTPEFARGLGAMALTFRCVGDRLVLGHLVGHGCNAEHVAFTRAMYENATAEVSRSVREGAAELHSGSEFLRGVPAGEQAAVEEALRRVGVRDAIIVSHPDGEGGWLTFVALSDSPIRTFPRQRSIWRQVCAHLATAWRLRERLGTARTAVEAVVSRSGRVVEASGVAQTGERRERLSGAAKDLDKARGALRRRDPLAALELWRGLVSGRWSLVDRVDTDGKRMFVAHRNDPATPDPRGLSARERAIVELVIAGTSNKHIGYTLGLGPGTVAAHLKQALAKLQVASRLELVQLGTRLQSSTALGDHEIRVLVVDGESVARALPLTAAEHDVAQLAAQGLTNAEIAERRSSAERTVANQMAAIYEKLGVGSRVELVLALSQRPTGT